MKYVNTTRQMIKPMFTVNSDHSNNSCDLVTTVKTKNATATIPSPTKILCITNHLYFLFYFICIS